MIFDTHAHYDDHQFDEDREQILSGMTSRGIEGLVNVACDMESCRTTLELAHRYDYIYGALGVHPSDIACLNDDNLNWIEEAARDPKIVAIGEIGLDYYWEKDLEVRKEQEKWFLRQLELARRIQLPVIIHSRDAAADTFRILMDEKTIENPGVVHCYSYSADQAREYVKKGYYIGVGGVVTYKNSRVLKEVVSEIPLTSIVLETDCPYLAPTPKRGSRNTSLNLPYVVQSIAEIKEITPETVMQVTGENARRLYQLT